jgi:hypothetical protein
MFCGCADVVLGASAMATVIAIAAALVVLSPITLRFSRMIWINFFVDYDKDLNNLKNDETILN